MIRIFYILGVPPATLRTDIFQSVLRGVGATHIDLVTSLHAENNYCEYEAKVHNAYAIISIICLQTDGLTHFVIFYTKIIIIITARFIILFIDL